MGLLLTHRKNDKEGGSVCLQQYILLLLVRVFFPALL